MKSVWLTLVALGSTAAAQPATTACARLSEQPALQSTCEFAMSLRAKLPDFICDQATSRFASAEERIAEEVIRAEVTYESGKEKYTQVSVNGVRKEGSIADLQGMWSIGEFGSHLSGIFAPQSRAAFDPPKKGRIGSHEVLIFRFRIDRANNLFLTWHTPAVTILPGVAGEVSIDVEAGTLVRLQLQATEIPRDFALSSLEVTSGYRSVALGDGSAFVLPVSAELRMCERGMARCTRNVTTFSNCRKFAAKTKVVPVEEKD